jgi:hypothetical protein
MIRIEGYICRCHKTWRDIIHYRDGLCLGKCVATIIGDRPGPGNDFGTRALTIHDHIRVVHYWCEGTVILFIIHITGFGYLCVISALGICINGDIFRNRKCWCCIVLHCNDLCTGGGITTKVRYKPGTGDDQIAAALSHRCPGLIPAYSCLSRRLPRR